MNKKLKILGIIVITLLLAVFFFMQTIGQIFSRKKLATRTGLILLNQIIKIIEDEETKQEEFIKALTSDYSAHAKIVSYVISRDNIDPLDYAELNKIAEFGGIDEINIFDEKGNLFGGSIPENYGKSLDSVEQFESFKPMLKDKNLTLVESVTLDSAEDKKMLYCMVWNESKNNMIQIGTNLENLIIKKRSISQILNSIPVYPGINVYIGNLKDNTLAVTTSKSAIGKTLNSVRNKGNQFDLNGAKESNETYYATKVIEGKKSYCIYRVYNDYIINIALDVRLVNSTMYKNYIVMIIYILIILVLVIIFVRRIISSENVEMRLLRQTKIDELSGLFNRRAYDENLSKYLQQDVEEDFVIVSADINELKYVNDNYGHDAGDELIIGASRCLNDVFGHYGSIYRTGGDEFIVILNTSEDMESLVKKVTEMTECWHGKLIDELSISIGYARKKDNPNADIRMLQRISDVYMYESKSNYYLSKGINRRTH